jgi:hypothetical protein
MFHNRAFKVLSTLILTAMLSSMMWVMPVNAMTICHVDINANGANNGTSWVDAYTDLQSALGNSACVEVWVAAGIYKPTTVINQNATFQLRDGDSIYGGFDGTETERNGRSRNPTINATILSTGGLTVQTASLASPLYTNNNFAWAKSIGGTDTDEGISIAADSNGNVYTTGVFFGTVDFDPSVDTYNLTSAGNFDIFVSKLDSSGNFVWAKNMGGVNSDWSISIALDSSGNVYTTGDFSGTADFDPGTDTYNLTSAGGPDIFISQLDNNGNFVWAKSIGGACVENAVDIAIDSNDNIYTTGRFSSANADFDPSVGTFLLTSTSTWIDDIFVSKLDSNGNFLWAKSMGGANYDSGSRIVVDSSGNVYTTGAFSGTADFDPGVGTFNLTSAGDFDVFISKLDSSGNFVWVKSMGGSRSDQGNGIAIGSSGDIYMTGIFEGTSDFDPSTSVSNLTSAGNSDIFVSKLDSNGNLVWAKRMGGVFATTHSSHMTLDANDNIYTTGEFSSDDVDFDPGVGIADLPGAGSYDVFISKLDRNGNFVWATTMGGTNYDSGSCIFVDSSGNVYTTGYFSSTADFDPGTSISNLTSSGFEDIFVSKLENDIVAPTILSIVRANSNPTDLASVDFTIMFSESVIVDTATTFNDFFLTTTGVTGASITGMSGSGATRTVTVNTGSGNGTIRLDVKNNGTIKDESNNPLAAGFASGEIYTVQKTLTLYSSAVQDGWILEKSENSSTGNTRDSASTTFRLGDDNLKKQYRSILSFKTDGLPDTAVITSVTLKIRQQSVTNGATFKMFGGLLVDIRRGIFGTTSALQLTDFQSTANTPLAGIGPFILSPEGGWYTINLTSGKANINKLPASSGLTQFRLRFKLDDNNNATANTINFFSGDNNIYKPVLIIQYYVP